MGGRQAGRAPSQGAPQHTGVASREGVSRQAKSVFRKQLAALSAAGPLVRDQHRDRLLSQVDVLTDSRSGLDLLLEDMPRLLEAGIFRDTAWAHPGRLVPSLVGGTLRAGGRAALLEILSELRIVALIEETAKDRRMAPGRARAFLEEVLVANLDLVFPSGTEAERAVGAAAARKIDHLVELLLERMPLEGMKSQLATELELVSAQRPVVTDRILEMCRMLREHLSLDPAGEDDRRILRFLDAVFAPSPEAGRREPGAYGSYLRRAKRARLEEECRQLGTAMADTGLAVAHHAVLLRRVARDPELLGAALALDAVGRAELERHHPLVVALLQEAVHLETARSAYGLGRLLERRLLSEQPVRSGLQRLVGLEPDPAVARQVTAARPGAEVSPGAFILADAIGVLGQPLGVGQGWNPTCQSARGISLWSRHAPGKLLGMVDSAARTGDLVMRFEGAAIRASEVAWELEGGADPALDALSLVLVPPLDRIYNEMMRRASGRGDDPHRWVNPAMYGHWIPNGFLSAYHYLTDSIRDYDAFVRTFYATHHPRYTGGHDLAYPNPVGIFLTSASGALVGFHAVSILRVGEGKRAGARGSRGVRVYFLNPNNEGRQQWAPDIRPTVAGHGEEPGESSLPFHQFASRVYAFHFRPSDVGELDAVDADEVQPVRRIAEGSWGKSYTWTGNSGAG